MMHQPKKTLHARWALLTFVVAMLAVGLYDAPRLFFNTVEDVRFSMNPSAARAIEIAEHHFDASDPRDYDFARAAKYFSRAQDIDPAFPLLNHQLARIEFLRGNFTQALSAINAELLGNPNPSPSSYYMKGLIEGYMGSYENAADDYAKYLKSDPNNWAALNDYAWVLLKGDHPETALAAVNHGLEFFPDNPWLLNSKAIALYEMKHFAEAYEAARAASHSVEDVTNQMWLTAYPGNDPNVASGGIATLRESIAENMHRAEIEMNAVTVQ